MKFSKSFKASNLIVKYCLLVLFCASTYAGFAQKEASTPHSITFTDVRFNDALKKAAALHKFVFVDAYASWCGPCKLLKATTFTNKKAAEFYNANFINLSIDMEKGEGPDLAQAWGITAYPTLIVFAPDGKPLLGTMGYMSADDLIKFGKKAMGKYVIN